jgi:hypothetical protein
LRSITSRIATISVAVVALFHQLEEDVGLFGLQRQIAKVVD